MIASRALVLVMLLIGASTALGEVQPDIALASRELVRISNEFRRANSLPGVAPNAQLQAAAQAFVDFIAQSDRFGHDADGATPAARATRAGYAVCSISENLGYQYHSLGFTSEELASQLVEGWKDSPSHRRNMLDSAMTDTGVAIARSARSGRYYAVQMYGRPRSRALAFEIANRSALAIDYSLDDESFRVMPRQAASHETCRTSTLRINWPGAQAATTLAPQAGVRYAIVQSASGDFELKRD